MAVNTKRIGRRRNSRRQKALSGYVGDIEMMAR